MKRIVLGGTLAVLFGAALLGQAQRPPTAPSADTLRAREAREREWQAMLDRVKAANEAARAEWDKVFQATRAQRTAFDRKMQDFADSQPHPPGTTVHTAMRVGDDGLPTSGEVWFVQDDFITYKATFDANGVTTGLVQTPDGKAWQNLQAHLPAGVDGKDIGYGYTTGVDGIPQVSIAYYNVPGGPRGTIRFNRDGNAYWGEFFGANGQRSGGFYDPRLEPTNEPPRALVAPPAVRIVTQPCPACQSAADAYNAIAQRMFPLQSEMARLARDNATTTRPGPERQAIESRFDVLANQWAALEAQLEQALTKLRICTAACLRPAQSLTSGATPAPGATPKPSAAAAGGAVANPSSAVAIRNTKLGQNTFAVLNNVPGPNNSVVPVIDVAKLDNGRGDFGLNAGTPYKAYRLGQGIANNPDSVKLVGAADFNNDGADDLVYLDSRSNVAAVALNDGANLFLTPSYRETGGFLPVSAAIGDVNDDDKLDLIVLNQGTNATQFNQSVVSVLLGQGDGRLVPTGSLFQVPNFGLSIVGGIAGVGTNNISRVVDFNNDGFPDFAVAATRGGVGGAVAGAPTISLLLNRPDRPGSFVVQPSIPLIDNTPINSLVATDVNGDGKWDFVALTPDTIHVLPGAGNGTFGAEVRFPLGVGGANHVMAVGDYNADGSPDLIVNGSVLLNESAFPGAVPDFGTPMNLIRSGGTPQVPLFLFGTDFNKDGTPDPLRIAGPDVRMVNGAARRAAGSTQQTRQAAQTPNFGLTLSTTADVNGDGKKDVVGVATTTGPNGAPQSAVTTFLGVGDGTFGLPIKTGCLTGIPVSLSAGDISGDGKSDEVVVAVSGESPVIDVFNFSTGSARQVSTVPLKGQPVSVTVDRFNGDAFEDIAFITSTPGTGDSLGILPGQRPADPNSVVLGAVLNGPPLNNKVFFFVPQHPSDIATNGTGAADSTADIAIATSNGVQIFETTQNPANPLGVNFAPPIIVNPGTRPVGVVLADVNRDNLVDVVSLNDGSGNISVNVAGGGGIYNTPPRSIAVGQNPISLSVLNFNNDASPDVAVINASGTAGPGQVSVFTGNGAGVFAPAGALTGADAFSPFAPPMFDDFDANNRAELVSPRVGLSYQIGESTLIKANYALYADQKEVATYEVTGLVSDLDGDNVIDFNEVFNMNGTPCTGACLAPFNIQPNQPITAGNLQRGGNTNLIVPVNGNSVRLPAGFGDWTPTDGATPAAAGGLRATFQGAQIDRHTVFTPDYDVALQVAWTSGNPAVATVSNAPASRGTLTAGPVPPDPASTSIIANIPAAARAEWFDSESRGVTVTVNDACLESIGCNPGGALVIPQGNLNTFFLQPAGLSQPYQAIGTLSDGSVLDVTDRGNWDVMTTSGSVDTPRTITVTNEGRDRLVIQPSAQTTGRGIPTARFQSFVDFGDLPFEITRLGDAANSSPGTEVSWNSSNPAVANVTNDPDFYETFVGDTAIRYYALQRFTPGPALNQGPLGGGYNMDFSERATWTSSNTAVATVSDTGSVRGLVTGGASGTTSITSSLTFGASTQNDSLDFRVSNGVINDITAASNDVWLSPTLGLTSGTAPPVSLGGTSAKLDWTMIFDDADACGAGGACPGPTPGMCTGSGCSEPPDICPGGGCSRTSISDTIPVNVGPPELTNITVNPAGGSDNVCGGGQCGDLLNFCASGGCNLTGGGDSDPLVQVMIVEVMVIQSGAHQAPPDGRQAPPSLAQVPRSLWEMLKSATQGGDLPSTYGFRSAPIDGRRDNIQLPAPRQANRPAAAGSGGGVQTVLTSLGTSTGEAFNIQVIDDGRNPGRKLGGSGVVLEPLKKAAQQEVQKALSKVAGKVAPVQKLDAYCLEMLKAPPSLGTVFRIASPELQKKFAPMRQVLDASRRLQQAGLLKPDSDPKAYFSAIKQWALWAKEKSFDQKAYETAFVEHTKKNAKESGVQWTNQIETAIRNLVPNRWADITKILDAAKAVQP